ncbi:MAG: enhanced serine sensitivity protein SseB [Ruminococcus flavefaciens]|nr:enhanced serine sensitivity protein SseB [Ruminococcus flavefaciens]MCM1229423.1 enhanced serine sensitivity protein SseB [Ruminococcus flavefaciens]
MNLDELLKDAITEPSKRSLFLQTLIKSDIYVICKNSVSEQGGSDIQLELVTTQNTNGDIFIPFFTSYQALQQFARRYVDCYKINCLRFFDLIQSASAVLNPDSYGKEFSSQEIKTILMLARNQRIRAISYDRNDRVTFRPCSHSVEHLKKAVSKFLEKQPNVESASVAEMVCGNDTQILFVLDMTGNTRNLFVPLSKYISKVKKDGEHLSFISCQQSTGKSASEQAELFYTRQKRFFEK